MAHEIQDKDLHFLIDPITRSITNQTAAKVKLMQFDHNSERFTFEVPRFVEGHDMTLCTKVEVHYINIAGNKQDQHADVYRVEDMATEGEGDTEKVTFSWLVSAGATQYAGSLSFVVRFTCLTGEKLDYAWSTSIFSGISIGEGMNNGDSVLEDYTDVLAVWEREVLACKTASETAAREAEKAAADAEAARIAAEATAGKSAYELAQMHGFEGSEEEWLASLKGAQGEKGEQGADGKDAVITNLAPTLEGNEADKAPCVKAVNDGLGGVANAIKGSKSGHSISLTDVSPITHNLSVKVSKEGVEDLSAVKVTARSKNMFNPNAWVNAIGKVTIDGIEYLNVRENGNSYYEIPGDSSVTYALSVRIVRNSDFTKGTNLAAKLPDGTTRSITGFGDAITDNRRKPIVYGGEKVYFTGHNKTDLCVDLSYTQLELGTTHTDFVPYVEPTESTANADGTVKGLRSIYPITEISTDTEGVVIECEYNRETNKALVDLSQNFGLTTERIRALDSMFRACAYIKDSASKEYNAFLSAFGLPPKLFAFTGSDFSQGGFAANNLLANYQSTVANRCSIIGLDLPVDKYAGKEVAFYISGVSEALRVALVFVTAEGLAVYGTQPLADLNIDAGSWFNSGDTYTIPDTALYMWITVSKQDNSNITPEEIANIVIEECEG